MMLYDCYYYYCHFLSKYHCFLQFRFFLKVIRNPASKSLQSIEISLLLYNDFIVNIYIQLDWEQVFTTY